VAKAYNGWDVAKDGASANTITTNTGLVANDLAMPPRKRKRSRRKPISVDALLNEEAPGAMEWAKKASEGE